MDVSVEAFKNKPKRRLFGKFHLRKIILLTHRLHIFRKCCLLHSYNKLYPIGYNFIVPICILHLIGYNQTYLDSNFAILVQYRFPDRLKITPAGRLPESLTREEFFNGISIPRNKELMRIYRDVELVESLGAGIPRILRAYGEDCFKFTDNFIRITLPISAHDHASDHASIQVEKLISILTGEMGSSELQGLLSIKNRDYLRTDYLNPAISNGYIELTIPDKPNSQNQKYRLTAKGIALKNSLTSNK